MQFYSLAKTIKLKSTIFLALTQHLFSLTKWKGKKGKEKKMLKTLASGPSSVNKENSRQVGYRRSIQFQEGSL